MSSFENLVVAVVFDNDVSLGSDSESESGGLQLPVSFAPPPRVTHVLTSRTLPLALFLRVDSDSGSPRAMSPPQGL